MISFLQIMFNILITTAFANGPVDTRLPTQARCDATPAAMAQYQACQEEQTANSCSEFAEESGLRDSIVNCQDYLSGNTPSGESMKDILSGCGDGTVQAINDAIEWVGGIPERFSARMEEVNTQSNRAIDYCMTQDSGKVWGDRFPNTTTLVNARGRRLNHILRSPSATDYADVSDFQEAMNAYRSFYSCYREKWDELNDAKLPIPSWDEIKQAISHLDGMRRCFRTDKQAEIVCPIIAEVVGGALVGVGVAGIRNAATRVIAKSRRNRLGGSDADLENDINEYIASTDPDNLPEKEKMSIAHQEDLLSVMRNPAWSNVMNKLGVDRRALAMGMMDSDMGKLGSYVGRYFFANSPDSNELIDILKGASDTPAGREFRKILDDNGFAGKNFLPNNLSNDEIRDIIQKNPVLIGYFHEMPGMHNAFKALNNGDITPDEFQKRMKANMFHNGPHAGFWEIFAEGIMPGFVKNVSGDTRMNSFFEGTVFDSGNVNGDGMRLARYPSPISVEGLVHTLADRFSQGTAGGIRKIAREIAGKPYIDNPSIPLGQLATGPNTVFEALMGNPQKTLKQLDNLSANAGRVIGDADALTAYRGLQGQASARIQKQIDFFNKRVTLLEGTPDNAKKYRIKFTDADGNKIDIVIDGDTPTDEAMRIMDKLTEAEEAVNGDAFKDFGKTNRLARNAALGAGGAVALAPHCRDSEVGEPGGPSSPSDTTTPERIDM